MVINKLQFLIILDRILKSQVILLCHLAIHLSRNNDNRKEK